MIEGEEGLGEKLSQAVAVLRADVPVRAAWREALIARIERDAAPSIRRGWTMRPPVAIAAGIALIALGGIAGRFSTRPSPTSPVAALQASVASVRFVHVAPGARHVSVVGDFNQWNPSSMPLRRLGDGTWVADVSLAPGRYAYAFVVDGKIEVDPVAPRAADDFGDNSVIVVRGS